MKHFKDQRGVSDNVFIFFVVALIVMSWVGISVSPDREESSDVKEDSSETGSSSFVKTSPSSKANTQSKQEEDPTKSPFYGQITIRTGNARSAYQPSLEYITLQMKSGRNQEPINITGWSIENGAGSRRYQVGANVLLGNTSRILIPQASMIYIPGVSGTEGPVILKAGEKAHLITGSMPPLASGKIGSFKVNKCTGYLEKQTNIKFSPSISLSCPAPKSYAETQLLEQSCYDFVRRISRCHTPDFKDVRRPDGGYETGGIDGVFGLTNQCKAFIQTTFNYNSCIANHINDDDFYKKEWRIYLNQPWELWAKDREVITLYDNFGRIVHQVKY